MSYKSHFNERLRDLRDEMGLTQTAAAEICGIKRETWGRYESGAMAPGMEVLAALARKGWDIAYLLTGIRQGMMNADKEYLPYWQAELIDDLKLAKEADIAAIRHLAALIKTAREADGDDAERKNSLT